MRTVVYQSFRTHNVPAWIKVCLESVKAWADLHGFDYRFYDDAFFDLVPPDLQLKAAEHKCVLADYARLVAARALLKEGWERAIWLDADAVVFAPEQFKIPFTQGYAFSREVWLDRTVWGKPQFNLTVNNAVSVFCQDQTIIDFYLDAANARLRSSQPLTGLSIGTEFLLKLQRARPFPLLTTAGIFGPEMTYRYLEDDGRYLRPYLNFQTSRIFAANLCLSHHSETHHFDGGKEGWVLNDEALLKFIARLRADQGASLNRWFNHGYSPDPAEFDRPLSPIIRKRHALKALLLSLRAH